MLQQRGREHTTFPSDFWWALVPLIISVLASLIVLLPFGGWTFFLRQSNDNAYPDESASAFRSRGIPLLEGMFESNQESSLIHYTVRLSSHHLLLSGEIIAWIYLIP